MSKSFTNILVILGIVATAFAAYYFFTQTTLGRLQLDEPDQQLVEFQATSDTYKERQRTLQTIDLDLRVLDYDTFLTLQDFTSEPATFQTGRDNPFVPAQSSDVTVTPPATSPSETAESAAAGS